MNTPTQAQIEAALVAFIDAKGVFAGNRKRAIEAALTAAAQVGEKPEDDEWTTSPYNPANNPRAKEQAAEDFAKLAKLIPAAQVGEPIGKLIKETQALQNRVERATIERCAQVLEAAYAECSTLNLLHGAARLRKLKDAP